MLRRSSLTHLTQLLAVVAVVGVLSACSGTRLAYETAQTLDAKAYVVTEHYAALLAEANNLADQPGFPRAAVERLQAADAAAKPLVLELRDASQAYSAVRSAENEAQLQEALNAAVLEVSDFINAMKQR